MASPFVSKYLFFSGRKTIAVLLSILILTTILLLALSTPLFEAKTILTINNNVKFKSDTNFSGDFKKHYLSQLNSPELKAEIVKSLNLTAVFYKKKFFRNVELFGKEMPLKLELLKNEPLKTEYFQLKKFTRLSYQLQNDEIIDTYRFGQTVTRPGLKFSLLKNPQSSFSGEDLILIISTFKTAVGDLNKAIEIKTASPDGSKIKIKVRAASKEKAAAILNSLYLLSLQNDADTGGSKKSDFIGSQLKDLQKELGAYSQDIEKLKSNQNKSISSPSLSAADVAEITRQLNIFKALNPYIEIATSQFTAFPDNYGISDEVLKDLINKMNTLQVKKQEVLDSGESTALVADIDAKIYDVNTAIKTRIEQKSKDYRELLNTKKEGSNLGDDNDIKRKIERLQKEQSAKSEFYLYLQNKQTEMKRLNNKTDSVGSRLQKSAVTYSIPVFEFALYFILAILIFALLFVFKLKSSVKDIFIKTDELKSATSIPELGTIKFCDPIGQSKIVNGENVQTAQKNIAINNLIVDKLSISKGKIVAISSYTKSSGKTFISINLAKSIASSGKKVILLDTCIQNFKARDLLGVEPNFGLTDYINNKGMAVLDIIEKTNLAENVSFISPGTLDISKSQLFYHSRMFKLLLDLKNNFDCIIIKSNNFEDFSYLKNPKNLHIVWINVLNEKEITLGQLKQFELFAGIQPDDQKYLLVNHIAN